MLQARTALYNPSVKPTFGTVVLRRQHPLAHGLIGAFLFNERGGLLICNLARDGNLSAPFVYTNISWGSGKDGNSGLSMNGSQTMANCPQIPAHVLFRLNRSAMSSVARVRFNTVSVTQQIAECNGNNGWRYRLNNTAVMSVVLNPGPLVVTGTRTATVGRWHDLGFSSGVGTGTKIFFDGQQDGSSGTTGTGSGSDQPVVFGGSSFAGEFLNGTLDFIYIWDRELRPGEFQQLHYEPYVMFRPVVEHGMELQADVIGIDVGLSGSLTTSIEAAGSMPVNVALSGSLSTAIQMSASIIIDASKIAADLKAAKVAGVLKPCGHPIFTQCGHHLTD